MIETVLHNDGIDAVVLAPLQSSSAAALAETADKPIIALDTDFTSDKKLSFVGTGNEAAAQAGGAVAMEKAKAFTAKLKEQGAKEWAQAEKK